MKRIIVFFAAACFLCRTESYAQQIWAGKDGNIRNIETRGFVIEEDSAYLATPNEVYFAADPADKWEPVFSIPSGNNEISCIAGRGRTLLVGTRRGLYRSEDNGKVWKNVFKTIIPEKSSVLSISLSKADPDVVAIGTERGVFISKDGASSWEDISGTLKNSSVKRVLLGDGAIYAGGEGGLYTARDLAGGWERIYVNLRTSEETLPENDDEAGDIYEEPEEGVSCIAVKGSTLYAGVGKNLFYSSDSGRSWSAMNGGGLSGRVNDIAAPSGSEMIYCATTKGVFEYEPKKDRWAELYKGMDRVLNINSITLDSGKGNSLWASTDKGLYKLESGRYAGDQYIDVERNLKNLSIIFDNEPPFVELQKAAIRHADVDPEKIRRWHRESRLKALAPKVSFGADRNTTDLWHWEGGSTVKENDDVLRPGRDSVDWDASVTWDIGNLIWSDDQTNIDVRSRLTTQLRNDILDDLRRVYFERKRLQFDLMVNSPKDLKSRFDKEIRIQELTQAIDDLTGNYLSEHIKIQQLTIKKPD